MGSWQDMTSRVVSTIVNTFTTVATYTPVSGAAEEIKGVFNSEHVEVQVLDGAEVQSIFPAFFAKLSDLPAVPQNGDQLTINATAYKVAESRPDGEGGTLLVLYRK